MATDYTIPKDEYRELLAENAKLRERVAELEELLPENGRWYRAETVEAYVTEIAKLRELVRIAVKHCDSGTCDGCPIQGESESCPYSDMARELGVEVDG